MGVQKFEVSGMQIEPLAVQMGQSGAIGGFGLQANKTPSVDVASPSPSPGLSLGR